MYTTPYKDWFNTRNELRENIYFYAVSPKDIEPKRLLEADKRAEREIAELEFLISQIKQYRVALSERYNEIQSLTYTLSLSLVRRCCYDNRKFYYVRIDRTYSNGAVERVLCEEYKGADRHKAIKRFKDLQKAHPGINATMDIKKRSWER